MSYSISDIAKIINASSAMQQEASIDYLLTDSRRIIFPTTSLFFALQSKRRDGHDFIKELYERGVRNFVIEKKINTSSFSNANFLLVENVLNALQTLAAKHRTQFSFPVIGITGSNGKTIVKEWLNQLLQNDFNIVRSPRSYNSQIGVPISVWQITEQNTLGIFEAGISTVGEMEKLEPIIQPTIGILTNIGEAHSEGFANATEKLNEKLKLFINCKQLIYCKDYFIPLLKNKDCQLFSWSRKDATATVFITEEKQELQQTNIKFLYSQQQYILSIPFTDAASIENAITCTCTLLLLKYNIKIINERIAQLQPVEMRMQLKKAINNCYVLNDSYSNDVSSLSIALDYLQQQAGEQNKIVILSDILQSSLPDEKLYFLVAAELQQRNVEQLIGIGENISKYAQLFSSITKTLFFPSTKKFLEQTANNYFKDSFILLKGARIFGFENIGKWLEQKTHQTVLEINLSALAHNLKTYQQHLLPTTKTMAMVKAFSYGSGNAEIARVLQFCKVDYLAVAYADEGVDLRKAGISLPIMVMNADEESFDVLVEYNLEPEIYSLNIYNNFNQYLLQQGIVQFPVHLKVNTGMNRLGFEVDDAEKLCTELKSHQTMFVKSIFSHLAASEAAEHDGFTLHQTNLFNVFCSVAKKILGYTFIKHIANSAGVFRHSNLQYDMVRLGIGLYGVDSANDHQLNLATVSTLKTTVAQIRNVKAGETVGYNRKGIVAKDSLIATIRIGYADGFSRRLSNGVGFVYINGILAPVIGSVCMDMTMIDVTNIPNIKEGDIVEIFGTHLPIQQVATWCNTISYEIMTGISQRVKRVYLEE